MAQAPSRKDVARDLIRRIRCRDSLHSFAMNIDVPTAPHGALCPEEELTGPARDLMAKHHAVILDVAERTIKRPYGRAIIMAPPGSAKSTYITVVVPPWAMGRIPGTRIIETSYASDLIHRQSRRARMICDSNLYRDIWDVAPIIGKDSDKEWSLIIGDKTSELLAAGITAGITGSRANGAIIDDPVSGREDADSPAMRVKTLNAYQDDVLTRLLPGAWIIIIMCMTGGTEVLMADGTERPLRDIRPDDRIATYDDGRLVASRVLNWKNQGADDVFEIELRSGIKVRANVRHPFLTICNGVEQWVKLGDLEVGDRLVVSRDATKAQYAKAGALTGAANSALTMITRPAKCADFSATTATCSSGMAERQKGWKLEPPTSDFTTDDVVSIRADGREDVFDVQVERTENFIANGVVSHNTRWNEQDLVGEILPFDYKGQSGMIKCRDGLEWEVLNIPAKAEYLDDPIGRKPGEYLWSDYYPDKHWQMFENGVGPTRQRTWSSLYQQRPSPQGSGKFTREMVRYYDSLPDSAQRSPRITCSDWAVSEGKNDFTEIGVGALDHLDDLYIIDWWYKQCDTGKGMEKFIEMIARHNSQLGFNEGGVIDKAIRPTFVTSMRDYNAKARKEGKRAIFMDLRAIPSMQDKLAKTSAINARMAMGKVWFPRNAPWTERVIEQLLALPAGRWDDAADVMGLFGRGLDQYHPPTPKTLERKEGIRPFTAAWIEYEEPTKPKVRYR